MKTRMIHKMLSFVLCAVFVIMALIRADSTDVLNKASWTIGSVSVRTDISKSASVDLSRDFECNEAVVFIKQQYSRLNKEWSPEDFNIQNVLVAEDISYINTDIVDRSDYLSSVTFRQILHLKLDTNTKSELGRAVCRLSQMKEVYLAVPDYRQDLQPCSLQNGSTLSDSKAFEMTSLDEAWKMTEGSHNVRVGVIDTGINENQYLRDNLVDGFNFASDNKNTRDDFGKSGHGTAVASVIGGTVTGVCKNVSIVPLKIVEKDQPLKTDALIRALNYANNNNIKIVNFSYGGQAGSNADVLEAAISDYNGLFVAASGNGRSCLDEQHSYIWYPTELCCDNMITVASLETDDEKIRKLGVCYYGMKADIAAPGSDITVIDNNGTVCTGRAGTSFAAPFVTGTAALLLSYNPELTTMQLKTAILNSADVYPELKSKVASSGCLNIYNALRYVTKGERVRNYIIRNEASSSWRTGAFIYLDMIYPKELYQIDGADVSVTAAAGRVNSVSTYKFSYLWRSFTRVFFPYGVRAGQSGSIADIRVTSRFEKDAGFIRSALRVKKSNCSVKQSYILLGDINNDGIIDSRDSDLLSSMLDSDQSSESSVKYSADVDSDGFITRHDLRVLDAYINGAVNSLCDDHTSKVLDKTKQHHT